MLIELNNKSLLNVIHIQDMGIDPIDATKVLIYLVNGETIEEQYSTESEASERVETLRNELTKTTRDIVEEGIKNLIEQVIFDNDRFIITFITHGGVETRIDFPVEATVTNGYYDKVSESLVLELVSGQTVSIPVSDLVPDIIGDKTLNDLTTEDKSSIVGAVNEINAKIGDIGTALDNINGEVI